MSTEKKTYAVTGAIERFKGEEWYHDFYRSLSHRDSNVFLYAEEPRGYIAGGPLTLVVKVGRHKTRYPWPADQAGRNEVLDVAIPALRDAVAAKLASRAGNPATLKSTLTGWRRAHNPPGPGGISSAGAPSGPTIAASGVSGVDEDRVRDEVMRQAGDADVDGLAELHGHLSTLSGADLRRFAAAFDNACQEDNAESFLAGILPQAPRM